MDATELLRERAVRLLAMAIQMREINADYADRLVEEAIGLQDQATVIEEAAADVRQKDDLC